MKNMYNRSRGMSNELIVELEIKTTGRVVQFDYPSDSEEIWYIIERIGEDNVEVVDVYGSYMTDELDDELSEMINYGDFSVSDLEYFYQKNYLNYLTDFI